MSDLNIRRAFEKRLGTMSPSIATQYENVSFTPTLGTPYQKTNLLPAQPDNNVLGRDYYREQGLFQVTLCYPLNKNGSGDLETRAELVRQHFKRGTSMTEGGQVVLVTRTPQKSPAFVTDDRYCVAISIYYQSEVF